MKHFDIFQSFGDQVIVGEIRNSRNQRKLAKIVH